MRAFDAYACALGTPSLVLMENAGRGAVDVLVRELLGGAPTGKRVVLVAGRGNNGGDAFVAARRLAVLGALPTVYCRVHVATLAGDALTNAEAFLGIGGQVLLLDEARLEELAVAVAECDAVVDGLFGTGLAREVVGVDRAVIELLAPAAAKLLALDVPSGLSARTGQVLGAAVVAAHTATFVGEKLGTATPVGRDHAGTVHVVDIGVPRALVGLPADARPSAFRLTAADLHGSLAPRAHATHKYRAGHVLVIAGSAGKTGAALLAAHGAARAGAGAITLASFPEVVAALESRVLESMTAVLDGQDASLLEALRGKRAVVLGPGLGRDARARALVARVLALAEVPVVLDADGFAGLEGDLGALRARRAPTALLPHEGELARLLGIAPAQVAADRFSSARSAALLCGAVVLLKGACTVLADASPSASEEVDLRVIDAGSPALAVAGSGDVLAGVVGALACEAPLAEASALAAYAHGAVGRRWMDAWGDRGLLAREIGDGLPAVLHGLRAPGA